MSAGVSRACILGALLLLPTIAVPLGLAQAGPNVTITPQRVLLFQSTLIFIEARDGGGSPWAGQVFRLCGVSLESNFPSSPPATLSASDRSNCPAVASTEGDGTAGVIVTPNSLSPIHVYQNDAYTGRQLNVTAGTLSIDVSPGEPREGDAVTFTVRAPGGGAVTNARLVILRDGAPYADTTTGGNGQFTIPSIATGHYALNATRSGYDEGSLTLDIVYVPPSVAKLVLQDLIIPTSTTAGSPVTATVTLQNQGNAVGTSTVALLVNNAQRDSQSVTVAPGEKLTLAFTFTPTVAGSYGISVREGGATLGPSTLRVTSPPPPEDLLRFGTISVPSEAKTGESVSISSTLTNQGTTSVSTTVYLTVNGATRDSASLTIPAGATRSVLFPITFTSAGSYQVSMETGSLRPTAQTLRVIAPAGASDLLLSNIDYPQGTATVGDPLPIVANYQNPTGQTVRTTALLLVDGDVKMRTDLVIPPGGSQVVTFQYTPPVAGSHRIEVQTADGGPRLSRALSVAPSVLVTPSLATQELEAPASPALTPWLAGALAIAALGAIGTIAYVARSRKRPAHTVSAPPPPPFRVGGRVAPPPPPPRIAGPPGSPWRARFEALTDGRAPLRGQRAIEAVLARAEKGDIAAQAETDALLSQAEAALARHEEAASQLARVREQMARLEQMLNDGHIDRQTFDAAAAQLERKVAASELEATTAAAEIFGP